VYAEEGIGDAELFGAFVENAQLLIIGMQIEAAPTVGNRVGAQRRSYWSFPRGAAGAARSCSTLRSRRCSAPGSDAP
jgi:hypothetical protein